MHVVAAFVGRRELVLAPGAGVLDLHEGAQPVIQQMQIGMGLQALHQVGIVVAVAQPPERLVEGVRAVADLAAELQPGRLGQAVIAEGVERIGALLRVIEKSIVLQPARQPGAQGPLLLERVGQGETGREGQRGQQAGAGHAQQPSGRHG
ncbi:hypothetical protein D3C76_1176460 [compost metagenome]